jgi:hypothetical protein
MPSLFLLGPYILTRSVSVHGYGWHINFIAIHKVWATHDIFKFNDIHKQTLHNSFKINQTKVRHDIKSRQLAFNSYAIRFSIYNLHWKFQSLALHGKINRHIR